MDFDGCTAIVTGGASGIGAATARLLTASGARVVIADLDERGHQVADEVGATFIRSDVRSARDADRLAAAAVERHGRLEVLVNCAGIVLAKSTVDTGEDEWDRVLDVNLKGTWLCSRAVIPHMASAGRGAIVNVASNAGLVGFANAAAYCASKGGVVQLTKAMALDCATLGIRVNAVCPGHTRTAMADEFVASQADPDAFLHDFVERQHPLGRMAEADEIGRCICFLASADASFVTGAVLAADGGFTAR
jgi:NAD(P)-dependent dehydrogenase (short-subunit alcohol dehydrogenase family)